MNTKSKYNAFAIGIFLRTRRQTLNLTMGEIAVRGRSPTLHQMVVHKIEKGSRRIKLSEVGPLSIAYGVDTKELLTRLGYSEAELDDYLKNVPSEASVIGGINPSKPVTIDDLKYLIGVSEGLTVPLDLGQVTRLLSQRR